jgi:ketosteroid isomerase-like protein
MDSLSIIPAMDEAENKQAIRKAFDEIATGNSRPFVELLADDATWTVKGQTPWSRTYRGKAAILTELLGELRARLADRYRATAERILADGDYVVVQARGHAITRHGVPYDNEYCFVYRMANGRIRDITEYLDTELVVRALSEP